MVNINFTQNENPSSTGSDFKNYFRFLLNFMELDVIFLVNNTFFTFYNFTINQNMGEYLFYVNQNNYLLFQNFSFFNNSCSDGLL